MGHHHDHTPIDWAAMGPVLERQAEVSVPMLRQAAEWLRERQPRPELIVDAGSGPGVVSCLLAEVFPGSQVVAVDSEEALLDRAGARAVRSGLDAHVRTHRARLPEGLDAFEAVGILWAGKSLHHIGDQREALGILAERLAPGGTLALLEGGLPTRCLPRDFSVGRPGLESRLDAAEADWFSRMRADLPGSRSETEDWPALLRAAGLGDVAVRTFLLDLPAPVSDAAREYLVGVFGRRREGLGDVLDAADLDALDRLLDPADPEGLHRRRDLFLLSAQTVHIASKA